MPFQHPYQTYAKARIMSEIEEVQEQMKADMEAMKEQMTMMMEAMMSMRKMMEVNTATVGVASTATEVDPIHPSGFNRVGRPDSDVVDQGGEVVENACGPHHVQVASIPSHHMDCLLIIHRPLLYTLLVRMSAILHPY